MLDPRSSPKPSAVGARWQPSRRTFLLGLAASGALVACSSDGDDAASIVGTASVVRFYGPFYLAGRSARVPFGLADDEGLVAAESLPDQVSAEVLGPDGAVVANGLTSELYVEGLPRPYYSVEFVPEVAGFHDLVLDTPFGEVRTQLEVVEEDDPVASAIVGPDDPMPALDTPTVDDARGVDPICTRNPPCDLHDQTLAEVVGNGRPSVVLVATPAFCQTAICGPVLDLLLEVVPDHPDVDFVHVEVYKDPDANQTPPVPDDFAPAVTALGLAFEPVLYTVDAEGLVRERLDYIFGTEEISAAVRRLVV